MALVGALLMVTHPGFTGAAGNFIGWFDLSVPTAPTWNAGNLAGAIQFTVPPIAVKQFFGRAYYIENVVAQPAVIFSDVLAATNVTSGNQALTFGDNVALTALGALPLNNQLGGKIQSLMVFKGATNIYQITGDAALSTLDVNALNVATGTFAPNTLCSTPKGLAFVSPEGLRMIDFTANVSDPIGLAGTGVTVPFIYSVVPSRMAAACNGSILRITTQNGNKGGSPTEEYWYDFARQIWHGPHSFPAALIKPYGNTFLIAPYGLAGSLWQSDPVQSLTSTFVENGVQMLFNYQPTLFPDADDMTNHAMTETTLDVQLPTSLAGLAVAAVDEAGTVLSSVLLALTGAPTIWGTFTWGAALWGGARNALRSQALNWPIPLVFSRMTITATGQCAQNVRLGTLHMRYQKLNYLTNTAAA